MQPSVLAATFTLTDGYDKRKNPATHTYRWMRPDEARNLDSVNHGYGEHEFMSVQGTARHCRLNGKVRTWKRDPARLEIPVKYGMREYATFHNMPDGRIGNHYGAYLIVRVSDSVVVP